jgi:hypothetical protein
MPTLGQFFSSASEAGPGAGSAVSDIFAGFGDETRAQGDILEAQNYTLASQYAQQEAQFTKQSTAIQSFQQQRQVSMGLGGVAAEQAAAGFTESGSALDVLRDSASQGALEHAVLARQGLITEASYKEQAASYTAMANAADMAAAADKQAATGAYVAAGFQAAGAVGKALVPFG